MSKIQGLEYARSYDKMYFKVEYNGETFKFNLPYEDDRPFVPLGILQGFALEIEKIINKKVTLQKDEIRIHSRCL
jgi:hypothetical protein